MNTLNLQSILNLEKRHSPLSKAIWRFHVTKKNVSNSCLNGIITVEVNFSSLGRIEKVQESVDFGSSLSWIDVNIASIFQRLWPLTNASRHVQLRTSIACTERCSRAELPVQVTDLRKVLPERRRARYRLQPVLALYQEGAPSMMSLQDASLFEASRRISRRSASNPSCHLQSYRVAVSKIPGLSHVILPKTFDIGVCSGVCSLKSMLTSPQRNYAKNHALMLALLSTSSPSCVPVSYNPIQVIAQGSNSLESFPIVDSVATECGCR